MWGFFIMWWTVLFRGAIYPYRPIHEKENVVLKIPKMRLMKCFSTGNLQGCLSHLSEIQNCLNPNWWFLNTIFGALERVTYGKSIRKLILKTKTWQVHLLINSSVGAHITSATGVLTTINPHFRQGEPYWHIFLIWIFNYSVVPHQIIAKLGTRPERFTQLQHRSRVLCSPEIWQSQNHISAAKQTTTLRITWQHELKFNGLFLCAVL